MSKISRILHKIFGINATFNTQMGKFGSYQNGSVAYAANAEEAASLANFEIGLDGALFGNNSIARQDMNAVLHHTSRQVGYLMQQGIPEWIATETYFSNGYCSYDGVVYKSRTNNNINYTPTSWPEHWVAVSGYNSLPSLRFNETTDFTTLRALLASIRRSPDFGIGSYKHGATINYTDGAYTGAVYSPCNNRIYLIPNAQSSETNWHYIDCESGQVVAYTHGASVVKYAYFGGAYSPLQNRIYMSPFAQGDQTNWHYIDCTTGAVVAYTAPLHQVANAYCGAVYAPIQNKIYFVPFEQGFNPDQWPTTDLVNIDCSDGSADIYNYDEAGLGVSYIGGVYAPGLDRIYFIPSGFANTSSAWHYLNCATGAIVAYTHGATVVDGCYAGGAYSPSQNRIYMAPDQQADQTYWHYINCDTGALVAYARGSGPSTACLGAVYSPIENKIYMIPSEVSSTFCYINCDTGAIVNYTKMSLFGTEYAFGIFSPTNNRIYFVPFNTTDSHWKYIQEYSDVKISRQIMANCIFNKL